MKIALIFLVTFMVGCNGRKDSGKSLLSTALSEDYNKGMQFMFVNGDSAYYYFNRVASTTRDSLQAAMSLANLASVQIEAGDFYGAQENSLLSLPLLDSSIAYHRYWISTDYNELAISSLNLKNFTTAIDYYRRAFLVEPDTVRKIILLNNLALVYQKLANYKTANDIYDSILDKATNDTLTYTKIISNRARTKWLENPNFDARSNFHTALQIRETVKDSTGLIASFSHLSDYYAKSNPDSSLIYANKMRLVAQNLHNPTDELEALQKIIKSSPPQTVQRYFSLYETLSDSIQTARNSAKNQFALIRYEAEKSKSDNLLLQNDNAEKKIRINNQRAVIVITLCISLFAAAAFFFWYRKRKQKMEMEAQHSIREHELKTSQKVHDVVANGLYRIMTNLEHEPVLNKDALLDSIDNLYEQSRDISYERVNILPVDFVSEIDALLKSFANPNTKVVVVGNSTGLWKGVNDKTKKNILPVLQELMVNMKKHSKASNVALKFDRSLDQIIIQYVDDGVGIPADIKFGNGLTNTENRISGMQGKINFDAAVSKGVRISISFPTAR